MIGHIDAQRRQLEQGYWSYADPANQAFAEGLQFFGISLPLIDAYIEKLETEGHKDAKALRQHRSSAFRERQNMDFSMRFLEAVLMHQRDGDAAKKIEAQRLEKQEAWGIAKAETEAAAKARKGTKKALTTAQETEIRKRLQDGESVSALARRYGVSRPTIDNCKPAKQASANNPFGVSRR